MEYLKKIYRNYWTWLARLKGRLLRLLIGSPGQRLIGGRPVRHVVSLGTHCLASSLLKRYGLKHYSLPFDWLFSSPAAVAHCVRDDFQIFLDHSYYQPVTSLRANEEPGAQHLFYLQRFSVGDMFAHRDPCRREDYRYFRDAVQRFRTLMASDDTKLFVQIVRPEWDGSAAFDDTVELIQGCTCNAVLLCIQLKPFAIRAGGRTMRLVRAEGSHELYEFVPSSQENGRSFDNWLDGLAIMRLVWRFKNK